jgi:hypothetical protein
MKLNQVLFFAAGALRRHRASVAILLFSSVLAACGGGGPKMASGGIVGTGDAGLLGSGAISAAGPDSITVNGTLYSLAGAGITVNGQAASPAALRVGMVVAIEAFTATGGGTVARSVTYRAEAQGVVTGVDSAAQSFDVLGQRIRVDRQTIFEGGTFATLQSQFVEVSGFRVAPGEVLASRVEIRAQYVPGSVPLEVTGTVGAVDAAARTLQIGALVVDYSRLMAGTVPSSLAPGITLTARGMQDAASGRLIADTLIVVSASPGPEASRVEVEGFVSAFANVGSFRVNGLAVDARAATFENGVPESLRDGVKVEVKGRVAQGVIVATKVEFEEAPAVSIEGVADAVDPVAGTLVVGGQLIVATTTTQFEDRSPAAEPNFGLAKVRPGDRISVRAVRGPAGLRATRIQRLERGTPPPSQAPVRVTGTVSSFVSTADFVVAGQRVNAASAEFVDGGASMLRDGVRVTVDGMPNGGFLVATTVTFDGDDGGPVVVEIEGTISEFTSPASFRVAGRRVDGSGATFVNGTIGMLADGLRVEVQGLQNGATVTAQKVTFKGGETATTIEVEGRITDFVSVSSFRVAGQAVDASAATIRDGTKADLADGRKVAAKGPLVGAVLRAASVEIEDGPVEGQEIHVQGVVSGYVSTAKFVVAGRTIDASAAEFGDGKASDLRDGRVVDVEGRLYGGIVRAKHVEFK